jgi:GNAT superfamily N-acetyltransferase
MTDQPLIRPVAREDFDRWLPLWEGYNAFYGRAGPTTLPEAITRTTWARFFDPAEPVEALVAELDGALVGLAHYLFHRSMILVEPVCYMQDLFTNEAARGRGVGRALIEAVYEQARAAGAASVYWHTHNGNATARRLYDQVADDTGFVVYRRRLPSGAAP